MAYATGYEDVNIAERLATFPRWTWLAHEKLLFRRPLVNWNACLMVHLM